MYSVLFYICTYAMTHAYDVTFCVLCYNKTGTAFQNVSALGSQTDMDKTVCTLTIIPKTKKNPQ